MGPVPKTDGHGQGASLGARRALHEVGQLYDRLWASGSGRAFDAADLHPAGDQLWFTGTECRQGAWLGQRQRVHGLDAQGALRALEPEVRMLRCTAGMPRQAVVRVPAPDAEELHVHWREGRETPSVWRVPGRVEHLAWSPDEISLLIQVAGARADFAGIAGGRTPTLELDGPSWQPHVEGPLAEPEAGRSVWVWSPGHDSPRPLTPAAIQCWEAAWCGAGAVLVVASEGAGEDSWYSARLLRIGLDGSTTVLRTPEDQIGVPCASPDGRWIAWIEAVCSDRGLVCGSAWLASGSAPPARLDLGGVEATHLHWRDDRRLVVTGLRSLETWVLEHEAHTGRQTAVWHGDSLTLGGWLPRAVAVGDEAVAAVVEGYGQPPRLAEMRPGGMRTRAVLAGGCVEGIGRLQPLAWAAPDGLEIHGWLVLPDDTRRRPDRGWPLLVDVHGGPIHAHRSRWAANLRSVPLLVARGWAVLLANPRGSCGRGQAFARQVVGDMGGADAQDLLAGIDHLVATGVADPARLAITGCSYGGFMACWLPTQCSRFAAAVAISPVTHWPSQHYGSHIPWFDLRFLGGRPEQASGRYHDRSPIHFAGDCRTPMLLMAGQRDRSTPPQQAQYFHGALQRAGRHSVLACYPEEGHSLRGPQGYLDSAARCAQWLERHAGPLA